MKKIRGRKNSMITAAVISGGVAVILAALTAGMWQMNRTFGIFFLALTCLCLLAGGANAAVQLRAWRAFRNMSQSADAPYAFVNEFGHLEIFGGGEDAVRKYVQFCVDTFSELYRPVGERPADAAAERAKQAEIFSQEKNLRSALAPYRQFDYFSPADLPFLQGKKIFVSERIYAYAATEEAWRAAREKNAFELLKNSPAGGAAQ